MTNHSSWKTQGMLATLLLAPGFQTSAMALATLRVPSVQKVSFYEKGKTF